eukprot:8398898-Karenia_brevis.AAC.1
MGVIDEAQLKEEMALHRRSNVARHSSLLDGAPSKSLASANVPKRVAWADFGETDDHIDSGNNARAHNDDHDDCESREERNTTRAFASS